MDRYERGLKLASAGHYSDAIAEFERALAVDPRDTRALFALGNAARALGMANVAGEFYRRVLAREPDRLEAIVNYANLLSGQGAFEAAEALIRTAMARLPDRPELLLTLGSIMHEIGRGDEAEGLFRAALAHRPGYVEALVDLADNYVDYGKFDQALALYNRAIKAVPGHAQAKLNRALLQLLRGNFEDGWRDFAARLKLPGKVPKPDHGLHRWKGNSLKHTRLLVTAEQGIGDQLMYASMLPELDARARERGGSLLLECEPRLHAVFARSFPRVTVHDWDVEKHEGVVRTHYGWLDEIGGANLFIEIGSLPKLLRKDLASFPKPNVYLKPDPEEAARWRSVFAALPRPWIGFSWRSGATGGNRTAQYAGPQHWAAFLSVLPGSAIVAQYGAQDEEISGFETLSGRPVVVPHNLDQRRELDRTMAMLSVCDAVVTAPTAVSWMAAAMGVITFKIYCGAGWAWTAFGQDFEPFTPAARCLMPATPGDWDAALSMALEAIKALLG